MAQIGARKFYWNGIKSETDNALPTYATTGDANLGGALADLVQANVTLNYSEGDAYADDKVVDSVHEFNYADIALQAFDVPLDVQEVWFGGSISSNVLSEGGMDSAGPVGCGFARTLRQRDGSGVVQTIWRGYYYPKALPRRAASETSTTKQGSTTYSYDEYVLRAVEANTGIYRQVEDFTTEAAFVTWIKSCLGIS